MRTKKIILIVGLVLCGFALSSSVFAQATITISPNLPGSLATTPSGASPGAFIKNFYQYALFISGFLAFAAIVYGGIRYTLARGNPSQETEAKAWIWSALLGLLLLAGAYLILFTINPNLVNLALPTLPSAVVNSGGGVAYTPYSGNGYSTGYTGTSFSPGVGGNKATNAIDAGAIAYFGTNTSGLPGTNGGVDGCAAAVNQVLASQGIAALDTNSVPNMEAALTSGGRGTLVADQSQAQPGDIVIQGQDQHVGVCMNVGCTQVLSNSSSKTSFSWVSNNTFSPSYSGAAGSSRIYSVNH